MMRADRLIHVLLLMTLLSVLSCNGFTATGPPNIPAEQPNVVSTDPQNWYFFYSKEVGTHPTTDPQGAWSFEFPDSENGGQVSYLQTPFNVTTTPHILTLVFRVESDSAQYVVSDPTDHPPATFHLFFEQKKDNLTNPNGRWWADLPSDIYNLGSANGETLTYVVPFTADIWGNVDGQFNAYAFADALNNVGWISITFGGQFFAGHGAAISAGASKFILIEFKVS